MIVTVMKDAKLGQAGGAPTAHTAVELDGKTIRAIYMMQQGTEHTAADLKKGRRVDVRGQLEKTPKGEKVLLMMSHSVVEDEE